MSFFEQGKTAYFAGIAKSSCPHKDKNAAEQWFEGWEAAKRAMNF